jgi:putative membrane protein
MIKKILSFLLINALTLWGAVYFLSPDYISLSPSWAFLVVGATLGILNAIVRPLLSLLSLPLIIITFGLFLVIINMFLLLCTEFLFNEIVPSLGITFHIAEGIFSYLITAIFLSAINTILHFFLK